LSKPDDPNRKPYTQPEIDTTKRKGPPHKFSAEKYQSICQFIERGLSNERAARASGIHPDTFIEWRKEGWRVGVLPELSDATKEAESLFVASALQEIWEDKSWTSKAWLLERRFPDEFGKRERREHVQGDEMRRFIPRDDGNGFDLITDHESVLEEDDG
jgi:hypothetical protein